MDISEAVVEFLVSQGIDTVFGIPGTQTLPLNRALEASAGISYVMARHETALSHQAWGYGQSSGRMAATLVVPGPGDMNAMNGLKNALNDCTPLLHLSIETDPDVRGGDGIHETPHDTYDNVVKENVLVRSPEAVVAAVADAVSTARTPPKGPVRVGIPRSFLTTTADRAAEFGELERGGGRTLPDDAIEELAARLDEAASPTIVAGGGVRSADAGAALRTVAETLSAPVFVTVKGKGVFPEDHELYAGVFWSGMSDAVGDELAAADATFAIGSDLDAVTTDNWRSELPNLLHVTLNGDDLGGANQGYDPAFGLIADANGVLEALGERLRGDREGGPARAARVRDAEAARLRTLRESPTQPLNSVQVLDVIRDRAPRETIVTADSGGSRLWTVVTFDVYEPRSYVNPGSWASMGTGLPAAIGAKVANPDRPVVSIIGDGGLMMCLHELHTAIAEGIGVITVVLNNDDYAIISEGAVAEFGIEERTYGWAEHPISFVEVAEGMGVESTAAKTPDEISHALDEALASEDPTLIEVPTDPREPQAAAWMGGD
jgi:acetolactate synthase-1/2/3 large subunit